jgi:hypothetical protein
VPATAAPDRWKAFTAGVLLAAALVAGYLLLLRARLAGPPLAAGITTRVPDAFYQPPADRPARPGVLLRHEPLRDVGLPAGLAGWRILYTTTIDDATPATAVATVFVPTVPATGPRPVVAWAHGTTGLWQRCMPSLASAPTEGIPARAASVAAGWVLVATDYSFAEPDGPHPYLVGEGEARAVLDGVRAARQLPGLALDTRTVVWGHSQGGHAALWAGTVAPRYAPDVPLAGVAAIAPAADPLAILRLSEAVDHRLGPYTATAYARFYPDVTLPEALRPAARAAGPAMAALCAFLPPEDPARLAALAATFRGPALATDTNPALVARLAANRARAPLRVPTLVAQGLGDFVVPAIATEQWLAAECAAGQALEYWIFAGPDHAGIVRPGSPLDGPLVAWTAARFAGEPAPGDCRRRAF